MRTRNYLLGLSSGYVVTITAVVVGLWLTPFTLRFLDREQFAIFALASDVLMWVTLLDLGISSGLNVQVAQLTGKPDQEKLNRLASTAFFTQILYTLAILIVGGLVTVIFPRLFDVRPDLYRDSIILLALLVLGSAVSVGVRTFTALLIAHQQIFFDNLIRFLLIALRTGLTVWLLFAGWGLLALPVGSLVATILTSLLAVVRSYRLLPGLVISRQFFSWDVLKSTGSLGIWFSLGGVAGLVINHLDRVMTAKLITLEMVTSLTLTGRIYALVGGLLQQITNTARPMIGQLAGLGKMNEVLRTYRQMFALSTGGAVVAAAALWSGNSLFVPWWVGSQNYGGTWLDLALAVNIIVHAWVLPNRAVLSANLIVKPQTFSRLVEGFLNIVLSILLARWIGVVGIVLSTAIAGFLTSNWYLPYLSARFFKRPYISFLREDLIGIIRLAILIFPTAYLVRSVHIDVHPLILMLIKYSTVGGIGLLLLWFMVFDSDLRLRILNLLTSFRGKFLQVSIS